MKWLDRSTKKYTRLLAQRTSRRSLLSGVGILLMGGAMVPLLPVARAVGENQNQVSLPESDPDDPTSCDYWRNCSISGYLCSCCGGTTTSCPPGTEMSPITWIGTCQNPDDDLDYIISYNDCCGKTSCGACYCNTNIGDRPIYRPHTANDYNWCIGTDSASYHCTVTIILGLATKNS